MLDHRPRPRGRCLACAASRRSGAPQPRAGRQGHLRPSRAAAAPRWRGASPQMRPAAWVPPAVLRRRARHRRAHSPTCPQLLPAAGTKGGTARDAPCPCPSTWRPHRKQTPGESRGGTGDPRARWGHGAAAASLALRARRAEMGAPARRRYHRMLAPCTGTVWRCASPLASAETCSTAQHNKIAELHSASRDKCAIIASRARAKWVGAQAPRSPIPDLRSRYLPSRSKGSTKCVRQWISQADCGCCSSHSAVSA